MNTKLDLYVELENEINKRDVSFDRDERQYMVIVEDGYNQYAYVEVYKNGYTGGIATYSDSDNSINYSNVGCPDFDNVEDAVDWLVTR